MMRRAIFLLLAVCGVAKADTGFGSTIRVNETDNSPACTVGLISVSPGTLTCAGQKATISTGGGSGGSGIYNATATAHFPFGFDASTGTFNGAGDGQIILNQFNSSYTVAGSSIIPAVGTPVIYTSTWGAIGPGPLGATPGAPVNSVQVNTAGVLTGYAAFNYSGSSLSVLTPVITSTLTVVVSALTSTTPSPGILDVYAGNVGAAAGTKVLATFGTDQQTAQIIITDRQPLSLVRYGADIGELNVGKISPNLNKISSDQAVTQYWDLWNSGDMDMKTASSGNGGKNIIFYPRQTESLRLTDAGATMTSSFTVRAGTVGSYEMQVSTTATFYHLAVSTNGHVNVNGTPPVASSCGTSPTIAGSDNAFTVTVGATTNACTVTFKVPFNSTPVCTVTDQTISITNAFSYSKTNAAITMAKTTMGGDIVDVVCFGRD